MWGDVHIITIVIYKYYFLDKNLNIHSVICRNYAAGFPNTHINDDSEMLYCLQNLQNCIS